VSSGFQRAQTEEATAPSVDGEALLVVELSDEFGQRRHPDKPNLRVDIVQGDRHVRFDQITRSGRRHSAVREFGLRVRDDLTPEMKVSTNKAVRTAKKELIKDLNRQHTEGARNARGRLYSPAVNKHHACLRPDLYKNEPTLFSVDDSKRAERELADRLRNAGYSVKGGH
jgi:hypothetical protein